MFFRNCGNKIHQRAEIKVIGEGKRANRTYID